MFERISARLNAPQRPFWLVIVLKMSNLPPPDSSSPMATSKEKKKWYKKWWVWVLAIVLITIARNTASQTSETSVKVTEEAETTVTTAE